MPQRETGMTPYEIMLSESQERMLMILKPEAVAKAEAIFKKWGLDYATVGKLTNTGKMVMKMHGQVVGELPVAPISGAAPQYERPYLATPQAPVISSNDVGKQTDIGVALERLISCPDLASKRWIWEQYDHMVMNDTVMSPGGDAGVVRVHGTNKGLAITTDVNPRYCKLDPIDGGIQAVTETYRNLTAVGAQPMAITNCLNFGNPQKPEIMGQIVGCILGMAEACTKLSYPVVSGNVSLYNETNGESIYPTPTIGGVGLLQDVSKLLRNAFREEGHTIYIIGRTEGHLGASLYLREIEGREEGTPPKVNFDAERRHSAFILSMNDLGLLSACHDISDGGLLVALTEMCFPHNVGAELHFPIDVTNPIAYAFGEDQGRYIIAVPPRFNDDVLLSANRLDIPLTEIGVTGGDLLIVQGLTRIPIEHLKTANDVWMSGYMSA